MTARTAYTFSVRYLWDEKGRALREAVNRAHEVYTRAAETSRALLAAPVSADTAQIIDDAARVEHQALEEYTEALRAFNEYANQKRYV